MKQGAAYECTVQYICKDTKNKMNKVVRFNDPERKINEKFVL